MKAKNYPNLILFTFLLLVLTACQNSGFQVIDLKVQGLINPIGIDITKPQFSWIIESSENAVKQNAYRILVSSSKENLDKNIGDLWDSEKVESEKSITIQYNGIELNSETKAYWKVKVWNNEGMESKWSEPAKWSIGLLNQSDWKAKWIGLDKAIGNDKPDQENRILSARYLRKEFIAEKEIIEATAYIVGLGVYELYLNGEKVGDHVLSPGLTEYPKRSFYISYDVTEMINTGENTVGTILGNGRYFAPRLNAPIGTITYGYPKMLLQVSLKYTDGSIENIISDETWKLTSDGPIVENNEYDGEFYDARKEMPGWNKNGFDDSKWINVELVKKPSEEISAQMTEPIRVTGSISPVSISNPSPGVYIFDMGQNMVGWTRLSVQAEAGTVVRQRFAETLKEDGNLYLANIRGAKVTDTYITHGKDIETVEPKFVFHGFRYVELTGYPGTPDLNTIEGKVVNDDLSMVGDFECSNSLINQIYKNAFWGIRGNYRSIPTDCPQRDERQGWLGDRATGSRGETYIFNVSNLYRKWLTDIFDAQRESGSISDVCPAYWPFYNDNVTWAGTPIQLVKMLHDQYDDQNIISDSYPSLKKWVDYMVNTYMTDDLMPRDNYGDWCVPPIDPMLIHTKDPNRLTDGTYLGTAFFYHNLKLMESYALMLNKQEDEKQFAELSARMKSAFNNHFFNAETKKYSNNSATVNILALAFNLVSDEYEETIFNNLIEKIEIEHDSHITTGLIGQEYFNRILTKYGRADLAYTVNTQKDYPSYGYMIENGATTIWELWNGNTADPAMNSGNHVMLLGDFIIWLYEDLAGIKPDENNPGFKHIIMKPTVINDLQFVKASHKSPYGLIKSAWEINGDVFNWEITIPANTTATVYVPGKEESETIGSGTYHFTSKHIQK